MVDDFQETVVSSDNGAQAHVMHNAQRDCGREHERARELHKLKPDTISAQWRGNGHEVTQKPKTYPRFMVAEKEKICFRRYSDTEYINHTPWSVEFGLRSSQPIYNVLILLLLFLREQRHM